MLVLGDDIRPLRITSNKFEEAIQSVLTDEEGNIILITAKKGTLSIQNSGEIYLGTLKVR
jgi:nucleoside-triphosphatase THEP1